MSTALRKGIKNLQINFSISKIFKLLYKAFSSEYVRHMHNLVIHLTKLEKFHLKRPAIVCLLRGAWVLFKLTVKNNFFLL